MYFDRCNWLFCRLAFGIVFASVIAIVTASAGTFEIDQKTVEFDNGSDKVVSPDQIFSLSFYADSYAFGSEQRDEIVFSIVPSNTRIARPSRNSVKSWPLYLISMNSDFSLNAEEMDSSNDTGDDPLRGTRILVNFRSPQTPGKYKIIYNKIPYFGMRGARVPPKPRKDGEEIVISQLTQFTTASTLSDLLVGNSLRRRAVLGHLAQFNDNLDIVTEFEVAAARTSELSASIYLRVNDAIPRRNVLTGGVSDKPTLFSWHLGRNSRFPLSNVTFRYQLIPDEGSLSEWVSATEVPYAYIPKGRHEFRVQAKYAGPEGHFITPFARYSFNLNAPFVGRISKALKVGPPVSLPIPELKNIYSGSKALLIGISKFDDPQFGTLPARQIETDVTVMKDVLSKAGFQITELSRPEVTKKNVLDAISDFIRTSKDNDRLFVYFSTHGFPDPDYITKGYIATTDCKYREASTTCIYLNSLREYFDNAMAKKVRQVVIAVDSCFAGLGLIMKSPTMDNLAALGTKQGIHMMTAGMEDQTASIDGNLRMSTFTHYLSKGLSGEATLFPNSSGVITLSELFSYVQHAVAKHSSGSQIPMMGRIMGSGEMLFTLDEKKTSAN